MGWILRGLGAERKSTPYLGVEGARAVTFPVTTKDSGKGGKKLISIKTKEEELEVGGLAKNDA